MKPAPFDYHVPSSILEAAELLGRLPDARVIAGGQSLLPMLNLRAVTPSHLIDIANIAELRGIRETPTSLVIGAMTTQRQIEHSELVRTHCPLLSETIGHVGHQQTRNRGTIGGSLCHLDPGAELPVAAAVLEATLTLAGPRQPRTLTFAEFPAGYLTTVLQTDEILTTIEIPKAGSSVGYAFLEFNQRPADFAVVCVAVLVRLDGGRIDNAKIAVGGMGYAPVRLLDAETMLARQTFGDILIDAAAAIATRIPCQGDGVNPPHFRQRLAGVLVKRALKIAIDRAKASVDA